MRGEHLTVFALFRKPSAPQTLAQKQAAAVATAGAALSTFQFVADDLVRAAETHEALADEAHEVADEHRSLARHSEIEADRARVAAANVYDLIGL